MWYTAVPIADCTGCTVAVRNDLLLVGEMVELERRRMNMFEEAHSIPSPWMELYYVVLRTTPSVEVQQLCRYRKMYRVAAINPEFFSFV